MENANASYFHYLILFQLSRSESPFRWESQNITLELANPEHEDLPQDVVLPAGLAWYSLKVGRTENPESVILNDPLPVSVVLDILSQSTLPFWTRSEMTSSSLASPEGLYSSETTESTLHISLHRLEAVCDTILKSGFPATVFGFRLDEPLPNDGECPCSPHCLALVEEFRLAISVCPIFHQYAPGFPMPPPASTDASLLILECVSRADNNVLRGLASSSSYNHYHVFLNLKKFKNYMRSLRDLVLGPSQPETDRDLHCFFMMIVLHVVEHGSSRYVGKKSSQGGRLFRSRLVRIAQGLSEYLHIFSWVDLVVCHTGIVPPQHELEFVLPEWVRKVEERLEETGYYLVPVTYGQGPEAQIIYHDIAEMIADEYIERMDLEERRALSHTTRKDIVIGVEKLQIRGELHAGSTAMSILEGTFSQDAWENSLDEWLQDEQNRISSIYQRRIEQSIKTCC